MKTMDELLSKLLPAGTWYVNKNGSLCIECSGLPAVSFTLMVNGFKECRLMSDLIRKPESL
jgi:hypothetical protein